MERFMKFKKLFDRKNKDYVTIKVNTSNVPDGLLRKCKKCSSIVLAEDVKNNNYICPKCGGYFRVHAYRRIEMVVDKDSFEPMFEGLNTRNPLKMKGYEAKVQALRDKTGLDEAVTTGRATIGGNSVAIAVCDGRFLMASMGEVCKNCGVCNKRKYSGYYFCLLRRSKNAGGNGFSYADGKDFSSVEKT